MYRQSCFSRDQPASHYIGPWVQVPPQISMVCCLLISQGSLTNLLTLTMCSIQRGRADLIWYVMIANHLLWVRRQCCKCFIYFRRIHSGFISYKIQALSLTPHSCSCKQIYNQAKLSKYTAVFAFSPDQVKIRDVQTNVNIQISSF